MNINDNVCTFLKIYYPAFVQAARDSEKDAKALWEKQKKINPKAPELFGVPARFKLAQTGLEKGWEKEAPGNNYNGIKADKGWTGKKQLLVTHEQFPDNDRKKHVFPEVISITKLTDGNYLWKVKDWFRAYDTAAEGIADHCKFLLENPRYLPAFQCNNSDDFAMAIAKAGYATAKGYGETIKGIMRDSIDPRLKMLGLPPLP
ncbi:glycoside hydrolase family 73 protein [Chitinophaga sp. Hz27]|uniref:glycoside hydrolase family 73 protein n=1 Tax=Chitinophaga sp. Hz27 TaxID=3347169 RepID=UPI0035E22DAC